MTPRISERAFEDAVEAALLAGGPDAYPHRGPDAYPDGSPGIREARPEDYDRALRLLPRDVVDFVLATQRTALRTALQFAAEHGPIVT